MQLPKIISYSVAAGILLLTCHTSGSPLSTQSETLDDERGTTLRTDLENNVENIDKLSVARQDESEDEDDENVETTIKPSNSETVTDIPIQPPRPTRPTRPGLNNSNLQSELNYVSQFQLGSDGNETLPQLPPQDSSPPQKQVDLSANIDALALQENEDSNTDDKEEEVKGVETRILPLSLEQLANVRRTGDTTPQPPRVTQAHISKNQESTQPQSQDNHESLSHQTDSENENQVVVESEKEAGQNEQESLNDEIAAGTTIRSEVLSTLSENDNQARRQQILAENDESNFTNHYHSDDFSQVLTDISSRADCACGKIPYSVPVGESGINQYPWTVALVRGGGIFGGGRPHCGGTLINDKYVLTASHCMDGLYPSDIQAWMTVHNTFESHSNFGTQKVNVQDILMHPNYNRDSKDNDVALLKLSQPIDISQKNYFVPACIPAGNANYAGSLAKVVAWSDGRRNQICQTDMPVLSNSVCSRDTKHRNKITDNMLCAGYLTPTRPNTCVGDAGGPLITPNGGRYTLIGAASWGFKDEGDYSPTVYSRVSTYTDWILHNTRDADWCGN